MSQMIGKKTKRKEKEKNKSIDKDRSSEDNKEEEIENKDNKKENNLNINRTKTGFNIKQLKEHIKEIESNKINKKKEEDKRILSIKPKVTKYSSSDSDSDSNSDSDNQKINLKERKTPEKIKEINVNKNISNTNTINNKKSTKKYNPKSHPEFTKSFRTNYTLSILIPSSIVDNAQSKELRTYLIGILARTIGIFKISEVIIFHDKLTTSKDYLNYFIKNLQYLETPQYLRKTLFPLSQDLALSGLMNPLESQHHLRKDEWSEYREGCVLNRPTKENATYSWVNIGLDKDCKIMQPLPPKTRVTVKLDQKGFDPKLKFYTGTPVSMTEPYEKNGTYWGYVVRVCESFEEVMEGKMFREGYDFVIGTSDKGEDYKKADFEKKKGFKHCLIVFGGISGIEGLVGDDEFNNRIKTDKIGEGFDLYLNTCVNQGLRTIRTEEAIMISLAVIRPELDRINGIE